MDILHPEVLMALRCPICHGALTSADPATQASPTSADPTSADPTIDRSVRCPAGHSFDPARQGYLPLTTGRAIPHGDTARMVAERARFLDSGHFAPLAQALLAAVPEKCAGLMLDAGGGTGHHLAAVLSARPGTLGLVLDASRYALRRAARAHPQASAVLCDIWGRLPIAEGVAAVVLNVFAPRNGAEFARVLRPDGLVVVVTPGPEHLRELVTPLGLLRIDPEKDNRTRAALRPLALTGSRTVVWRMTLARQQAAALAGMGPSAQHITPDTLATRIACLPDPVRVTAQVTVSYYRLPPISG